MKQHQETGEMEHSGWDQLNWSGACRRRFVLALFVGWALVGALGGTGTAVTAQGADGAFEGEVRFKEPSGRRYRVADAGGGDVTGLALRGWAGLGGSGRRGQAWVSGQVVGGNGEKVQWGSRVVLEMSLESGLSLEEVMDGAGLTVALKVREGLYLLQAPSAEEAVEAAQKLSGKDGVKLCVPVMRRPLKLHGGYVPAPNDPLYGQEWHLENRGADGQRAGPDLNIRAAWGASRGLGVKVAVADTGVQSNHPDLADRLMSSLGYNFYQGVADGNPYSTTANHGTAVAGLVAARGGNGVGVAGVAPAAGLVSWVIFGSEGGLDVTASDEQLMGMFQRSLQDVQVQNHSWGSATLFQQEISVLEDTAIERAVTLGRGGKGVILVRAAGNARREYVDANDDGYSADPRSIAVGAVRRDGRACSYSSRGASLLVSAPSGDVLDVDGDGVVDGTDPDAPGLFTTDRTGNLGYAAGAGEAGNYFDDFNGTSASAPEVAGLVALALSVNPKLGYRDVQHLLVLSARHFDLADPDLRTNGAGLRFSHNVGFGVPDAGTVVELAPVWSNRPARTRLSFVNTQSGLIPDDSLRLLAVGAGLSATLTNIRSLPSLGVHPDAGTKVLPLVYVGLATSDIALDLRGKAALIQRGTATFAEKIARAAKAGAELAVIFNNTGTSTLQGLGATDFAPIPALSIGQTAGQGLRSYLATNGSLTVQARLSPVVRTFDVKQTLICEHVGVRVRTTHKSRQDVRVTLVSPSGNRSVLQRINADVSEGPVDWTYWSVAHCLESSFGVWRVEVSDQRNTSLRSSSGAVSAATGSLTSCELILTGVSVEDTDHDGLSDAWERNYFGDLARGPMEDPDEDGWNNAAEQVMGTHPQATVEWRVEWSALDENRWRLGWSRRPPSTYAVMTAREVGGEWTLLKKFSDLGTRVEWILPKGGDRRFFKVVTVP